MAKSTCRWHWARGQFRDVEVVEPYAKQTDVPDGKQMKDPVIIAFGGDLICVPAHQLYGLERPPRPEAPTSVAKGKRRAAGPGVTTTTIEEPTTTQETTDNVVRI